MLRFLLLISIVAAIVASWYFWSFFRRALLARRASRASREYANKRPRLEQLFCAVAGASGKPRGLAWKRCDLQNRVIIVRDRANGELLGLAGATISFAAIEGGEMEEVAAVSNLRAATAIFQWNGSEWNTQGRAIFNLEPSEVLRRYSDSLDEIAVAEPPL